MVFADGVHCLALHCGYTPTALACKIMWPILGERKTSKKHAKRSVHLQNILGSQKTHTHHQPNIIIMGAGGRSSMDVAASAEPNQLMQRLAQDPQYAPFYEDTFDVAQFVSSSLTQSSIAARGSSINVAQTQIDRIQEGVTLLDGVVRAEVTR